MKKFVKVLIMVMVILLIGIQFIRTNRTNPITDKSKDISNNINTPVNIRQILERSCFDCHSNNTKWPWYSYVAPASWLVAYDVNEGRENMNFSEWGTYSVTDQIDYLEHIIKQVKKGEMPLGKYVLLHWDAKLSDADKDLLCKWAASASDSLMSK